jgi:hypothetical protein
MNKIPITYAEPFCDMSNRMKLIQDACEFGALDAAAKLVLLQLHDTVSLAQWIDVERRRKL